MSKLSAFLKQSRATTSGASAKPSASGAGGSGRGAAAEAPAAPSLAAWGADDDDVLISEVPAVEAAARAITAVSPEVPAAAVPAAADEEELDEEEEDMEEESRRRRANFNWSQMEEATAARQAERDRRRAEAAEAERQRKAAEQARGLGAILTLKKKDPKGDALKIADETSFPALGPAPVAPPAAAAAPTAPPQKKKEVAAAAEPEKPEAKKAAAEPTSKSQEPAVVRTLTARDVWMAVGACPTIKWPKVAFDESASKSRYRRELELVWSN